MKNIDNIVKNIGTGAVSAANIISKKASNVYGISKSKLEAESIKRMIRAKYAELGKLNYKSATEGTDVSEEANVIISEISDLKAALLEIKKNIASAKEQKICPQCKNAVAKNSVFCNFCGTKFEEDVEPDADTEDVIIEADGDEDVITEVEIDIEVGCDGDEDETEIEEATCKTDENDSNEDESKNADEIADDDGELPTT